MISIYYLKLAKYDPSNTLGGKKLYLNLPLVFTYFQPTACLLINNRWWTKMPISESTSVCSWPLRIHKIGDAAMRLFVSMRQWMSFLKLHREFLRQPFHRILCSLGGSPHEFALSGPGDALCPAACPQPAGGGSGCGCGGTSHPEDMLRGCGGRNSAPAYLNSSTLC